MFTCIIAHQYVGLFTYLTDENESETLKATGVSEISSVSAAYSLVIAVQQWRIIELLLKT